MSIPSLLDPELLPVGSRRRRHVWAARRKTVCRQRQPDGLLRAVWTALEAVGADCLAADVRSPVDRRLLERVKRLGLQKCWRVSCSDFYSDSAAGDLEPVSKWSPPKNRSPPREQRRQRRRPRFQHADDSPSSSARSPHSGDLPLLASVGVVSDSAAQVPAGWQGTRPVPVAVQHDFLAYDLEDVRYLFLFCFVLLPARQVEKRRVRMAERSLRAWEGVRWLPWSRLITDDGGEWEL